VAGIGQEDAFGIAQGLANVSLAHLVTEDSDVRFGAGRPEYEGLEFGFGHVMRGG
jgi:hypothetical protein